jgi:hypothetical protein
MKKWSSVTCSCCGTKTKKGSCCGAKTKKETWKKAGDVYIVQNQMISLRKLHCWENLVQNLKDQGLFAKSSRCKRFLQGNHIPFFTQNLTYRKENYFSSYLKRKANLRSFHKVCKWRLLLKKNRRRANVVDQIVQNNKAKPLNDQFITDNNCM